MKVLVAEDSRTQALRLRADLDLQGFEVVIAFNGRQALELAASERPDVILSDVLMPEIDGLRLCRELQLDPALRSIPVVLRSAAFLEEEDRNLALAVGAYAYVEKSVEGRELARILLAAANDESSPLGIGSLDDSGFSATYERRLLSHLVEQAAHSERINDDLKQAQQLLQAVMDNSPALVWVKDLNGRYLIVNKQLRRVFGVGPEELIGKAASAPFVDDQEEHEKRFKAVIEAGRPIEFEESASLEDGAHTYLTTQYPLKDGEGRVYAVSCISLDITERKRLEERLLRVQKMEVIGQLSGGIAHDFNNLLSVIINYATFASEGLEPSDERSRDIQQVVQAAERGSQLVRQLLTFSRGGDVTAEAVELNEVIAGAEGLLRGLIPLNSEIVIDLDPHLRPVRINPDQLGQVLVNLVVNARDAMPGGGTISVATAFVTLDSTLSTPSGEIATGEYARLSVADTGTGMTDETIRRIFDPFFTTKGEGKGTGLGLSTVHGIVTGVGGGVAVDSEVGRGTTFHVHIPFQEEGTEFSPVDRSREDPPAEVRTGAVLVVDDEEGIRATLGRALSRQGYDVLLAESGEEAVAIHSREPNRIALLITDLAMSGMSGRELDEQLARENPDLRVIYMSGSGGMRNSGFPAAAAPFLPKPFTITELLTKVQRALGDTGTGPAPNASEGTTG